MTVTEPVGPRAGGSFLIERHEPATIQVPEERGDELRLMAHSARQFVERELLSEAGKLEVVDYDFLRQKLQRAGEQGLLGVDVPEEHGGLAASKTASMLVAEQLASSGSFNVTFNAHTGIGTLPIVYFGTGEQQERYRRARWWRPTASPNPIPAPMPGRPGPVRCWTRMAAPTA